ncbi:MAG: ADP-ribosylglycohydrolase family protein [Bacteroidetes bacterium]|nr:ADP-ribosylglycohydrolase family protein [Bacteroidota bacterium]
MKILYALIIIILFSTSCKQINRSTERKEVTIAKEVLKDKIMGGWAGKAIGCTFGGPTEFKFQGTMIQDYQPIHWDDHYMKWWYDHTPGLYDDVYMDLTFVDVYDKLGIDAPVDSSASAFAHAGYMLWHANQAARYNILNGIKPPQSGHWLNNPHADCIDFQIEADFAGLMSPGMPNTASEYSDKIGHIMNYGDGWYGGVYVANMLSLAFISNDINYIVTEALKSIPKESEFYNCMNDVIKAHKKNSKDWKACWFEIEKKWTQDVGCPDGVFSCFDIDAKVNSAYVIIGLLYGEGDFTKTMEIATRCGQDSDCNPSTAAGILGTMLGYNCIPETYKKSLKEVEDMNFKYTTISLNKAYQMGYDQALKVIKKNGGKETDKEITIATQVSTPVRMEKSFEGHFPIERRVIDKQLSDNIQIEFEGNGIVLKGNTFEIENGKADQSYVAKAEVTIDNQLIETIKMPLSYTTRKHEVFWKYELPNKKHTMKIKWLNPEKLVNVKVTEAIVYSTPPINKEIK